MSLLASAWISISILAASPSHASTQAFVPVAGPDGFHTVIDLLTIGPGHHLWTSFGHTAIMVMRFNPTTKESTSVVYNWGDADFDGWGFMLGFLRGQSIFRISKLGTLEDVVNTYAPMGRQIHQQRFTLSRVQAEHAAARLREHAQPQNRDYIYHHINATCATKVRDFIDHDITQGAVAQHFGNTRDPRTPRQYGRQFFAGFFLAELFNDTFMGRYHDAPWTKYAAMTVPTNLSKYLQEVMVAYPKGGPEKIALLSKPTPVVRGIKPMPYRGEGRSMIHITYLLMVLVGGFGLLTVARRHIEPTYAGMWLLSWSLLTTFAALCMIVGALISTVIEGRVNELMMVFPITDMLLIPLAIKWWLGSTVVPQWLRVYGWTRFAMVCLCLLLHAGNILTQEPVIIVWFGLLCTGLLVAVLEKLPKTAEDTGTATTSSAVTGIA